MVQVPEEQTVRDESSLVLAFDRLLADPAGEVTYSLHHVIVGHNGANNLDEILDRRWVEEVQPHHSRWLAYRRRELRDRER